MAKASLTIAIGGEYQGKDAIRKAESELKALRESARQAGGGAADIMKIGDAAVDVGSALEVGGAKITDYGTKLTKLTAPIAAVGAAAVALAADYEDSVAKVYTIMDKQAMSTEDMSKSILDLSTATGKSADELADATYQALSASVETDKVAGFVSDAIKLSKAGFTSTTSSVDALTTVINAYKLSAEDAMDISDKLVQTQNDGKTTVDELASSMGTIIPTAAALNVNLDNVLSSYAIMTKQGIKTNDATTALKNTLSELSDEGSTVASILSEKTGKTFGQLMEDGMSLGDVLGILYESVDGNGEAFKNLWGNMRAGTGALAIASAGTEGFNSELSKMQDAAGNVESALEDLQTPTSKLNKAINALKNTGIELGEEVIEAGMPMVEQLVKKAQDLYKWFGNLDKETKQNAVRMAALAVAAGPVVAVVGKLVTGVGGLVTGFGKGLQKIGAFAAAMQTAERDMRTAGATTVSLGDKMKAAANKTGLLTKASSLLKGGLAAIGIAAAAAAVGLIIDAYMKWKEHNDMVVKATKGLKDAVGAAKTAYDDYKGSVDKAATSLANVKTSAEEALKSQADLADSMTSKFKDVGTNAALVEHYAQTIADLGNKGSLTDAELETLKLAVDQFNQYTGAGISIIDENTGALDRSTQSILNVAAAYAEEARQAAAREMMIDVYKQIMENQLALEAAQEEVTKAEEAYQKALKEYPAYASTASQAVTDSKNKVNELTSAQKSAKKTLKDLTDMAAQTPSYFSTMEGALGSVGLSMSDLGELTDEQMQAMQRDFDGTLSSIYYSCQSTGVAIPQALADGIANNSYKAENKASSMASGVASAAGGADMWTVGHNAAVGFENGYASVDLYGYARGIASGFLQSFKNALGINSPSKEFAEAGEDTVQGAIVGMRRMEGALEAETGRLSDIVTLEPTVGGTWAMPGATQGIGGPAFGGFGAFGGQAPTINVYITPQAGATNSEVGRMAGREIAEAMYLELSRQEAGALWRS